MKSVNLRYWLCQVLGWGLWCAFGLYVNLVVYEDGFKNAYGEANLATAKHKFYISLIITFITAIVITHILRLILKRIDWLRFSFNRILLIFVLGIFGSGIALYFISDFAEKKFNVSLDEYRKETKKQVAIQGEADAGLSNVDYYSKSSTPISKEQLHAINSLKKSTNWYRNQKGEWTMIDRSNLVVIYQTIILSSLWLLIYFMWHYIERTRKDRMDRFKLEATVKELELKTIKAHINPHFIFNSLNSIRALVDENPERARTAITELSNILRSSLQAEKLETVTLEKEIDIVKDYLALEKMRFEDRLNIEYHIDEDTLDQQVPPMMLQTLVENAIKHGVSKQIEGGTVKVYSDFVNSHYELKVENTGILNAMNNAGFGLKSTQDRLKLLFGPGSSFNIKQATENTVAVTVALPLKINKN